jgi:hypothetical protein
MKIETSSWSAIPVDYDELWKFANEATDEIERLRWALTTIANVEWDPEGEYMKDVARTALGIVFEGKQK